MEVPYLPPGSSHLHPFWGPLSCMCAKWRVDFQTPLRRPTYTKELDSSLPLFLSLDCFSKLFGKESLHVSLSHQSPSSISLSIFSVRKPFSLLCLISSIDCQSSTHWLSKPSPLSAAGASSSFFFLFFFSLHLLCPLLLFSLFCFLCHFPPHIVYMWLLPINWICWITLIGCIWALAVITSI